MSVSFSTIIQKARPNPLTVTSNAMREALAKVPPSHVTKLSNGVRVATEHNHNAKFATVGIWIDAGTRYDMRHQQGMSKVLQYAGFQGTTSADRQTLSRTIDELGGQLTVETGRELSFMSLKVAKANVPKAVEFLADIYRNARLSEEDVTAAKAAVETARHQNEENVDNLLDDNLHVCAYDATFEGGLGNKLYGTPEGIQAVTKDALLEFRNKYYTAGRTIVVGSGAVSQKELEGLAQQFLGDLADKTVEVPETRFVGGDIRLWNVRNSTWHGQMGVETMGAMCGDTVPLTLVTHIHGHYHRSQHELGQHALHRLAKMYSSLDFGGNYTDIHHPKSIETLDSYYHQYSDTGLLGMKGAGRQVKSHPHYARSMGDIFGNAVWDWSRIARKAIDHTELAQAKVNYKAQLMYNLDGTHNNAKDLARQVHLYGRRVPLEEMFTRIDDLSPSNVQETLSHYFIDRKPVYSFYGYFYPEFGYDVLQHYHSRILL
eukprot:CAMPEP_0174849530 /NCGR_PEP_ID=MMETSP1114-20130205/16508_1 /TAXON_ID=312471 /ORGANISM="Neobodo designis, Strain CCAP 1951/1" /LENGTH=487 /DNA_ID=CAMNT_0016083889 /DNA_START=38 /DNA_END=1501 /DNA_ORIENTATION=+